MQGTKNLFRAWNLRLLENGVEEENKNNENPDTLVEHDNDSDDDISSLVLKPTRFPKMLITSNLKFSNSPYQKRRQKTQRFSLKPKDPKKSNLKSKSKHVYPI